MSCIENKEDYQNREFFLVDLSTLKPGMLLDRPLYMYFSQSNKYIKIANSLTLLSQKTFEKLLKQNQVFSSQKSIDERYPILNELSQKILKINGDESFAPFEKNYYIQLELRHTFPFVFEKIDDLKIKDLEFVLFFMQKTYELPPLETLEYMENLSIDTFLECLKKASLCGFLALFLGYTDATFLQNYMLAVFCEGAFAMEGVKTNIPFAKELPFRFKDVLESMTFSVSTKSSFSTNLFLDELWELSYFVSFLMTNKEKTNTNTRIVKKLCRQIIEINNLGESNLSVKEQKVAA